MARGRPVSSWVRAISSLSRQRSTTVWNSTWLKIKSRGNSPSLEFLKAGMAASATAAAFYLDISHAHPQDQPRTLDMQTTALSGMSDMMLWDMMGSVKGEVLPAKIARAASDQVEQARFEDATTKKIAWYARLADVCGDNEQHRSSEVAHLFLASSLQEASIALLSPTSTSQPSVRVIDTRRTKARCVLCISEDGKTAFVAVRGSVNLTNFLHSFMAWPKFDKQTSLTLHSGFCAVADELLSELEEAIPRGCAVHVTGHSLGGAVGAIIARRLHEADRRIMQVVTFGTPKHVWTSRCRDGAWQADGRLTMERAQKRQKSATASSTQAAPTRLASGSAAPFPFPLLRVEHVVDPIPFVSAPPMPACNRLLSLPQLPLPVSLSWQLSPASAAAAAASLRLQARVVRGEPRSRKGGYRDSYGTALGRKEQRAERRLWAGAGRRSSYVHVGDGVLVSGAEAGRVPAESGGGVRARVQAHRMRTYRDACVAWAESSTAA